MTISRPTVLIVEDEAPLRRVLGRALERRGFRVLLAATAEAACDLLASEPADAVLLDIHLPMMSGLALSLLIKTRWPRLAGRIAIMTGDAEAAEVRAWTASNPCTVLRKPFELREILEWVGRVVQAGEERGFEAAP